MFTNDSRLRFLLRPEHYFCPEHYELELQRLFRPSWQFACAASELKHTGDFLTLDLSGTPVILRNFGDNIVAFENICPHRHAMLTSQSCGNCDTLRCQYHGWEFKETGGTGKIPEAKVFRPWDRDNSSLKKIKIDQCGDLIFVALSDNVPPLRDWLDPFYDEFAEIFTAPQWEMRHVLEFDCECNWKIPTENFLESYHVTALHPKWFDSLPSENLTHHELESRYTSLEFDGRSNTELLQARVNSFLGGVPTRKYHHRHIHPNTIVCTTDTHSYVLTMQPTSPTTVRVKTRFFGFRGTRRGLMAKLVFRIAWELGKRRAVLVQLEDKRIFTDQQRGLQASRHPGVIGAREERVHQFQRYLLETLDIPFAEDPADDTRQRVVKLPR